MVINEGEVLMLSSFISASVVRSCSIAWTKTDICPISSW